MNQTVCTVYELIHGEQSEGSGGPLSFPSSIMHSHLPFLLLILELHGMDETLLLKALRCLEAQGKAQVFTGASKDDLGVKFL